MIIVAGRIHTKPGKRDEFVARSREAVEAARRAAGCKDFIVAADPVEDDRVNVYEEWDAEDLMLAFRGDGPGEDLSALVDRAHVRRHEILKSGPP